jgi:hypothetical protein
MGFSLADCLVAGFSLSTAEECKEAGFSAADCISVGFPLAECKKAGFSKWAMDSLLGALGPPSCCTFRRKITPAAKQLLRRIGIQSQLESTIGLIHIKQGIGMCEERSIFCVPVLVELLHAIQPKHVILREFMHCEVMKSFVDSLDALNALISLDMDIGHKQFYQTMHLGLRSVPKLLCKCPTLQRLTLRCRPGTAYGVSDDEFDEMVCQLQEDFPSVHIELKRRDAHFRSIFLDCEGNQYHSWSGGGIALCDPNRACCQC